jgi:cbb3-type cytochrome oxidase subunit 3
MNRYGQSTSKTASGPSPRLSPAPPPAPAAAVVPPAERARRRALCTRVILRAMKLKLAVAFAEWRCETINLNRERAIRQAEFIRRLQNRSRDLFLLKQVHLNMKIAFGMWRTATFMESKSREDLASELIKLRIENDELKNRVTLLEADTVRSEIVHQEVFEKEVSRVKDEGDQLVATVKAEKDKEIKDLICRRVILRALNSKLAAAFNEWSIAAKHISKREKIVKKVVRVMQSKQVANAFRTWRVNGVFMKAQEAESTCMSLFKEKMELETSRRKQREEVARRALSRAVSQRLFAGFQSWKKNVERIVKVEKLLMKTISRMRKQSLNRGFRSWHDCVIKMKQKEAQASLHLLHQEKSLILSEFEIEKERAIEQARAEAARAAKERLARRVILKALNSKMAAGFRSWQQNVRAMNLDNDAKNTLNLKEEILYRDRVIKQHEAEINRLIAEKAFELQQHHETVTSKKKEALCRRVVLRAMNSKMASGFSAWKASVESSAKRERVIMRVAKTITNKALSKTFRSWATAIEIRKCTERTKAEILAIVAEKDALLSAHQAELSRIKLETETLIAAAKLEADKAKYEADKAKLEAAARLEAIKSDVDKSRRETIFRRFFSRALHAKLSMSFIAWKDNVAEIVRRETLLTLTDENASMKASYEAELKRLQDEAAARLEAIKSDVNKSRRETIFRRFFSRALHAKLSMSFIAWKDNVAEIVRRETLLTLTDENASMKASYEAELKRLQDEAAARLEAIKSDVNKSRRETIFRRFFSRALHAKLSMSFIAWKDNVAEIVRRETLLTLTDENASMKASYEAELKRLQDEAAARLEAIKSDVNKSRRETIFRRFFSRALHAKLSMSFIAWKDNVAEIVRRETLLTLTDENASMKASYEAELKRLQDEAAARLEAIKSDVNKSRRETIFRRFFSRALHAKLSMSFIAWKDNVAEIVRRETLLTLTDENASMKASYEAELKRLQDEAAARLEAIKSDVNKSRRETIFRRFFSRALHAKLSMSFIAWKDNVAEIVRRETLLTLTDENASMKASYEAELKRLQDEAAARLEAIKSDVNKSRRETIFRRFFSRALHAKLSMSFIAWKDNVAEIVRRETLLTLTDENASMKASYEAELKRLQDEAAARLEAIKSDVNKSRRETIFRRFFSRALHAKLSMSFIAWKDNVAEIVRRETLLTLTDENASMKASYEAELKRLQDEAAARLEAIKSDVNKSRRETIFRRFFSRALHAKLSMSFIAWKDNVAEIVRRETLLTLTDENASMKASYEAELKRLQDEAAARLEAIKSDVNKSRRETIFRRFFSRALHAKLSMSFIAWKDNVAEIVRRETLLTLTDENASMKASYEAELKRLQDEAAARLEAIKSDVNKSRRETIFRRFFSRALHAKLSMSFIAWKDNVAEIVRRETLLTLTDENASMKASYEAELKRLQDEAAARLEAIKSDVNKSRRETIFRRFFSRALHAKLSMSFIAWKDNVAEIVRRETLLTLTDENASMKASYEAELKRLQDEAAARLEAIKSDVNKSRRETIFRRFFSRALHAKLSMSFIAWKDNVAEIVRRETLLTLTDENASMKASYEAELKRLQDEAAARLEAIKSDVNKSRRETIFRRFFSRALHAKLSMSFIAWKDNVAEIVRRETLLTLTDENASMKASYEAALKRLQDEAADRLASAEKSHREAICRRVILRALNSKLSVGFIAWKDNVADIVRREKIVNRALKMMQNRSLSRSFRQWVSVYEDAKQERAAAATALMKASYEAELKRLQDEAADRLASAEKSRRDAICRRVILRALNSKLSVGFIAWKDNVADIVRREKIVNRALKMMQNRSLSRSFRQWVSVYEDAKQERAAAATAALLAEKDAMKDAMKVSYEAELKRLQDEAADRLASAEKSRRDAICRRVILRALNSKLSVGFIAWKDNVADIVRRETLLTLTDENASMKASYEAALKRLQDEAADRLASAEKSRREAICRRVILRALNSKLSVGFIAWKDNVADIVRREKIVNRALKMMQNRSLSRSFRQWVSVYEDAKQERAAAATAALLAEKDAMKDAMKVSYEAELKRLQDEAADRLASAEKSRRDAICRRVILRALNSKLSVGFIAWKDNVADIVRRETLLTLTDENASMKASYEAALKRLQDEAADRLASAEKSRREAICRRVILRALNSKLSVGFIAWKDNVADIVRREKIVNRALKMMQNRSLSRSFRQWVSVYEDAKQERAAAATAALLAEKDAMKDAMKVSYEAELKRLQDEAADRLASAEKSRRDAICRRVILRALNSKLSVGFIAWKDNVADIVRREKIVNRALKMMQNRSLSRSFRQWVSVYEDAKQERAAAATAALLAEKDAMKDAMKVSYEAELKRLQEEAADRLASAEKSRREAICRRVILRALNSKLSVGFIAWKDNVADIVRREKIVNRALKMMQNRSLSRSFRQWVSVYEDAKQERAAAATAALLAEKDAMKDAMKVSYEAELKRLQDEAADRLASAEKSRRDAICRRVILRALNSKLSVGFIAWKDNVADIVRRETLLTLTDENASMKASYEAELKRLQDEAADRLASAEKSRREAICRRVILRALNSKLSVGFIAWKDNVADIVRREKIVNRALKMMQNRSLSRSFRQWVSVYEDAKQERAAAATAALLAEKDAMKDAMKVSYEAELKRLQEEAADRLASAEKSRRDAICRRVILRALNSKLSVGFIAWKDNVADIVRREKIVNRALKMMQNRSLSRSFRQWVSVYEDAKQERAAAATALLKASYEAELKRLQDEAADRLASAEKSRRDAICRRVILRALNSKLSVGFIAWKDNVADIVRREKIVNRALKMMQNRSLSRSFRQWVSVYEDAKQERAAAATAALLAEKDAMKDAMKVSYEAELKRLQEEAADRLASAEKSRRDAICRRVILRALNSKLSVGFIAWKDNVADIVRREKIVNRALKMMQNRSLSRSFRQWVSVYEDAKQERAAAATALLKASYEAELKRLQDEAADRLASAEKSRRDAICRRVILRALNSKLSVGFIAWKDNVADIVRREKIVNRALKMMQNRSLSRSFRQWVSVYEDAKQERAAAATAALLAEKDAMKDAMKGIADAYDDGFVLLFKAGAPPNGLCVSDDEVEDVDDDEVKVGLFIDVDNEALRRECKAPKGFEGSDIVCIVITRIREKTN